MNTSVSSAIEHSQLPRIYGNISEPIKSSTSSLKNGLRADCPQIQIRELITELKNAWAHTEEYQSSTPLTDDGDTSAEDDFGEGEDDSGDQLCPQGECQRKFTTRWNVRRHWYSRMTL